jgi:hypothetical protein
MPLLADRVRETSVTTGTGTLTLDGAVSGYRTFSTAFGNGASVYYVITSAADWEIGIGTTGAGTLSRDTVLSSTNSNNKLDLVAGTKEVFCAYVGSRAVTTSDAATLTNKTISGADNTLSNIGNASLTNSSVTVNGTSISLGASGTVTADAGTLTGNTLASGVTASSLTSVGTLASLTITGDLTVDTSSLKVDSTNNRVGIVTASPSHPLHVVGTSYLQQVIERATVSATAATGTINYDALTQAVLFYTSNASGNWTLNLRGSSTVTMNTLLAVNDSITLTFLVTQGATPYYASAHQIDGSSVTPKWQGGTAPTAGNASGIDIYTYTVIKTAATPTYTVLASQTKFT